MYKTKKQIEIQERKGIPKSGDIFLEEVLM